jgi:hypothetical protein
VAAGATTWLSCGVVAARPGGAQQARIVSRRPAGSVPWYPQLRATTQIASSHPQTSPHNTQAHTQTRTRTHTHSHAYAHTPHLPAPTRRRGPQATVTKPFFWDPSKFWEGATKFPLNYYIPLEHVLFYTMQLGFYLQVCVAGPI